jgi:hypothetical protein
MAVYQGARPRSALVPGRPRTSGSPALPRRVVRAKFATRAHRRSDRGAFMLGGIVLAFLLAFFSLVQTMAVSATSYDIDKLRAEQSRLEAQENDLRSNLNRLGREPAIRKLAIDAGLGQLGQPIIVPAR